MQYNELEHLSNSEFKRLCGVSRSTFSEMVEVLRPSLERQGRRGGQPKLSVEDQLSRGIGILARVPQPISHWSELGIARDHGGANCSQG